MKSQFRLAIAVAALGAGVAPGFAQVNWKGALDPVEIDTIAQLEAKGEKGDVEAMETVAIRLITGGGDTGFESGEPTDAEIKKGIAWYKKAADAGSIKALTILSGYAYSGFHMPEDADLSFRYRERAAELGDAGSMSSMGYSLLYGRGVKADSSAARTWLEKAAAKGYGGAYEGLAIIYGQGIGVAQDQAKTCQYMLKAAENEEHGWRPDKVKAGAAYFVAGGCALQGIGLPKDNSKGVEYIRKAADYGHPTAKEMLAAQAQ